MDFEKAAEKILDKIVEIEKSSNPDINPDGTHKGGFDSFVKHMQSKGLSEESAQKLCAYIESKSKAAS